MPVPLETARFAPRCEGEERLLELVPSESLDLDTPHRIANPIVGNLRKRNANLGDPPLWVDGSLRLPHRIPGEIEIDVVAPLRGYGVAHRTAGSDTKEVAAQVVVPRIERDGNDVAIYRLIAPREARPDLGRVALEHPRAKVDGLAIDENSNVGALCRWLALLRVELGEARDGLGGRPGGFVEPAIDRYGAWRDAASAGDGAGMGKPLGRLLRGRQAWGDAG